MIARVLLYKRPGDPNIDELYSPQMVVTIYKYTIEYFLPRNHLQIFILVDHVYYYYYYYYKICIAHKFKHARVGGAGRR